MLVLALVVSTSFFIWTMHFRNLIRHISWPLVASLLLNVMLVVTLVVMWQVRPEPTTLHLPAQRSVNAVAKIKPETTKTAATQEQARPFHWRQLEAPDFPTYVKNLRAIGCPEATIRDIIQCELNEVYAAKRQEIEREIATAPPQSRPPLKERLQHLNTEETAMFSASLSSSPATYAAATQSSPSAQTPTGAPSSTNVQTSTGTQGAGFTPTGASAASVQSASTLTPTAFLAGNDPNRVTPAGTLTPTPTDPSLNPAATAIISQMRTDFASAMQDVTADPSSPVYRERWLSAQRASDEQFSSMFGGDYFIKTQLEAVRNAAAANAAAAKP